MPALNFREIPQANSYNGQQDTFELLAKEFFRMLNMRIVSGPDRGQDGGKDLIIEEHRQGALGSTMYKWLVSCKHRAHSGKSVLDSDEQDITDRVRSHGAKGFIGFYSTLPSSGLSSKLERLRKEGLLEYKIMDASDIESALLTTAEGRQIARRYFPQSYAKWNPEIFSIQSLSSRQHAIVASLS
jgi:hypothetical protein